MPIPREQLERAQQPLTERILAFLAQDKTQAYSVYEVYAALEGFDRKYALFAVALHFQRAGDSLRPVPGDVDAAYTEEAYDLNDPRKLEVRRLRAEALSAARGALRDLPGLIEKLEHDAAANRESDTIRLLRTLHH